jgi:hypothetical protein
LLLVDRAMNLDLSLRMEFQGCNEDATELHVNGEAGAENAEFSDVGSIGVGGDGWRMFGLY